MKDYKEHIGGLDEFNIKKQIIEKNYQTSDNLRNIKRKVMNDFVELVGEESAWK